MCDFKVGDKVRCLNVAVINHVLSATKLYEVVEVFTDTDAVRIDIGGNSSLLVANEHLEKVNMSENKTMSKKHKWYKEIQAWAYGARIQKRDFRPSMGTWCEWRNAELDGSNGVFWCDREDTEYRIAPEFEVGAWYKAHDGYNTIPVRAICLDTDREQWRFSGVSAAGYLLTFWEDTCDFVVTPEDKITL